MPCLFKLVLFPVFIKNMVRKEPDAVIDAALVVVHVLR